MSITPARSSLIPILSQIAAVLFLAGTLALVFNWVCGLAVALILILILFAIHLRHFATFVAWLEAPLLVEVPETTGSWGNIFSQVYKARKKTEKNEAKLEEKEARFRKMLSALPDGITLVRKGWEIEWTNPIAERDFGISGNSDIGKSLASLVNKQEFLDYLTQEIWEKPLNLVFSETGRILEIRVLQAEKKYWIVVSRDVTEPMRVDAMRRDFVANVSHELRTPLTVVKGFLEIASDDGTVSDEQKLHWRMMKEQADRMEALVGDLLTLSRLERDSAPAVKDEVNVRTVLEDAAEEGRMISQGRHTISLEKVCDDFLLCDRKEMRSAITNLVSNAVRYTPDGGRIDLSWTVGPEGGTISVKDTGIGLAPEDIPRVTERFYRVDKSRSRETGGTGLGLAIVKHVLLRHQAQLKIASELGVGSDFRIIVPSFRVESH